MLGKKVKVVPGWGASGRGMRRTRPEGIPIYTTPHCAGQVRSHTRAEVVLRWCEEGGAATALMCTLRVTPGKRNGDSVRAETSGRAASIVIDSGRR